MKGIRTTLGVAGGLAAALTLGVGEGAGNYIGHHQGVSAGRIEGQQGCLDTLSYTEAQELGSFTVTAAQVQAIKGDPVDYFYDLGSNDLAKTGHGHAVIRQLEALVPDNGRPVAVKVEVPFTGNTVNQWNPLTQHPSTYRDSGRADAAALSAFLEGTGANVLVVAPGGVESSEDYPKEPLQVVVSNIDCNSTAPQP